MAGKKKNESVSTEEPPGLRSNPFAALLGGATPGAEPDAEPVATAADAPGAPRRAIVRYQRKGRGGKEVTSIELRGGAVDLAAWLSDLKRELGCGGFVEEQRLVLSGDQRGRLRSLLEGRGVAEITAS